MEIFVTGLAMCLLWLWFARKGLRFAVAGVLALAPFGMLAAVNLPSIGGLSLKVSSICAGLILLGLCLAALRSRDAFWQSRQLGLAELSLLALVVISLVSSLITVRIFAGSIEVYTSAREVEKTQVNGFMGKVPLQPSSSNLSQPFYLLLSVGFFFAAKRAFQESGTQWVTSALALVASVHLGLAVLDAFEADALLAPFRTANYALLKHHTMSGFPRVIGGMPEPSSFGGLSATLFAFFGSHALLSRRRSSTWLALSLLLCVIVSFSSTAYLGTFVFFLCCAGYAVCSGIVDHRLSKTQIFLVGSAVVGVLIAASLGHERVLQIFDSLIINKLDSRSGIERSAWAWSGFETFVDTYGLGAGLGSIRANGWASAYLGSVGLLGTVCAAIFWLKTLGTRRTPASMSTSEASLRMASKAAILTAISMKMLTATGINTGFALMLFAALLNHKTRLTPVNSTKQSGVRSIQNTL